MTTSKFDRDYLKGLAVIALALAIVGVFVGMIRSFLIALFLAAVFSAIAFPLFRRINRDLGDRSGLAAMMTLFLLIAAVVLPGIALLHVVSEQAQAITQNAVP